MDITLVPDGTIMWNAFIIGLTVLNAVASLPTKNWNEDIEIVGGHEIDIKQAPHQVWIGNCGGSIVSKDYVITAAHCVRKDGERRIVRAGSTNRGSGGIEVKGKAIKHPKYAKLDYDVALIKLEKPLELSDKIKVIQLAPKDYKVPAGDLLETSGWGATVEGAPTIPDILRMVKVPKVGNDVCEKAYGSELTDRMICAGEAGKDACQGDSGGPLVHKNTLVGITSWGNGCARPDYPGVYARVAALRQWIDEIMN